MKKLFTISLALLCSFACTQQTFRSGIYASGAPTNQLLELPILELNVPGDEIISGQWKSLQNPKIGKITSSTNILKNHSFSIYLPECKKDLPVSIEQTGNDLKVEMSALPACEVSAQTYTLHLHP